MSDYRRNKERKSSLRDRENWYCARARARLVKRGKKIDINYPGVLALKDFADDGRTIRDAEAFARVKLIIASRKLIIRKFVNGGGGGGGDGSGSVN